MSVLAQNRCLVLNKCWTPIHTVSLKRAILMLFSMHNDGTPKARVIDPDNYQAFTWEDWSKIKTLDTDDVLTTSNCEFKVPEVILLSKYDKMPKIRSSFSRRNLYKRDNYRCQYCGKMPGTEDLTLDHVLPKSRGGKTSWENCVLACVDCNSRKADKLLKDCGMKLLSEPKKPKVNPFKCELRSPIKSWSAFISDVYWQVELENDNK